MCIDSAAARIEGLDMRRTISGGTVETEIYTTEGGYVAIKQPAPTAAHEQICLLSVDQLPQLIRELQLLYDDRKSWEETSVE
jgi:hypothetical protein